MGCSGQLRALHSLGVEDGQAADWQWKGAGKNLIMALPWEASADDWQLEGSQMAAHYMKETPRAKSGERSGEIPSKRKALCWRTHLDPICHPSSLEMHQTV